MKNPLTKASEVIGVILSIGISAWIIATIIEAVLFCVAIAVGLIAWFSKDFFTGLTIGFLVFVLGQMAAIAILDIILSAPERNVKKPKMAKDEEVIRSLRAELETKPNNKGGDGDAM